MVAKFWLVALVLFPGESVWEEHARVPVYPATQKECDKQLRLAGNAVDAAPLQVMFQCYDESAPVIDHGASTTAGYSLEKTLPDGSRSRAAIEKEKAKGPKAILINP